MGILRPISYIRVPIHSWPPVVSIPNGSKQIPAEVKRWEDGPRRVETKRGRT